MASDVKPQEGHRAPPEGLTPEFRKKDTSHEPKEGWSTKYTAGIQAHEGQEEQSRAGQLSRRHHNTRQQKAGRDLDQKRSSTDNI